MHYCLHVSCAWNEGPKEGHNFKALETDDTEQEEFEDI